MQSQKSDLEEIYRLERSIENKNISDPEVMSANDKIISITDNYNFSRSPEKKGSGLMEDIHCLARSRASALDGKCKVFDNVAEKLLLEGNESQANEVNEKCKILRNQWLIAKDKFIVTIKVL